MSPEPRPSGPADAAAAAVALFRDVIPGLEERAADYRVSVEVIDDEIRGLFAEQVRLAVEALTGACAGHDETTVRERGHSLEGMGGTLGFPEISVAGWALCRAARQGDWPQCAMLTDRLVQWARVLAGPVEGTPHD